MEYDISYLRARVHILADRKNGITIPNQQIKMN